MQITSFALRERGSLVWLNCFIMAIVSALLPFFSLNLLASVIIKLCVSIAMVLFSFKIKKASDFAKKYLIFIFVTFVFGGGVAMVKQTFSHLSVLTLLVTTFALFILSKIVIRFFYRKKVVENFSTIVKIVDGEKTVEEKAFFDSGNLLYDPITNQPISLITHEVFCKLFELDILSVFLKKIDEKKLKNGHYIFVKSATKGAKMLIFEVDKLVISEKTYSNACLGISFSGFEKAMNSNVLLHSSQTIF